MHEDQIIKPQAVQATVSQIWPVGRCVCRMVSLQVALQMSRGMRFAVIFVCILCKRISTRTVGISKSVCLVVTIVFKC